MSFFDDETASSMTGDDTLSSTSANDVFYSLFHMNCPLVFPRTAANYTRTRTRTREKRVIFNIKNYKGKNK